jgi:hypothetical protein
MKYFTLCVASLLISMSPALAQNAVSDVSKGGIFDVTASESNNAEMQDWGETHPLLRISPDKSELIKLDRDAVSVIVGNPQHLSVLLDTPNVLVLVPRAPGATYFTALDRQGEPIMARHVVVAAPEKQYIRVRRSCINAEADSGCTAQSVYFCPDMCHEIGITQLGSDDARAAAPEAPDDVPAGPIAETDGE